MWKSVKDDTPRGNTNIVVMDKHGGLCIVRTLVDGSLPRHRYMMKTRNNFYYASRGLIVKWMDIGTLKLAICSDTIGIP